MHIRFLILGLLLFFAINSFSQTSSQNVSESNYKLEVTKAIISAAGVLIPALVGIFTLWWQAQVNRKNKKAETKAMFQLKAAEIVLNSTSPGAAVNRSEVIYQLFKEHLPDDFVESFDPKKLPGTRKQDKLDLLRLILQYPDQKESILKYWKALYPDKDNWVDMAFTK